ncbi:agmatinase [Aeribacillus composti]|uniref:agmatinase n=1 Tax=Aeribacillus composti TaxID=1868734 RepID=UPI002E2203C2|nr:agmatinase [Aeribacillus composti]
MAQKFEFVSYTGNVSFFGCKQTTDLNGVDVAVVGVPFDCGVSNRPGARFGPRAIREASLFVGKFHYPWNYEVTKKYNIIDYGDIGYSLGNDPTTFMIEETYENAKKILASGAKLLSIGGDHTIPYGLVRAASEKYGQLALLHFDSHEDTQPGIFGGEIYHGSFAYDLQKEGCIDPSKSVQVYIRTNMTECGYNIIYANEAMELDPKALAERIKKNVGEAPVYLTFDIDCLDPAYAPGTGTPVIGGPSTQEVRNVLFHLKGLNIVAADLVEVAPVYDPAEITRLAAATIAKDLLYLMVD